MIGIRLSAIVLMLLFLSLAPRVTAQEVEPAPAPATEPAEAEAQVAPEARELLDRVRDAYAKLDSLELSGTIALDLDVAGQPQNRQSPFTASFLAPNRFRHEASEDALVVSDGSKVSLYVPRLDKYLEAEAPAARAASAGLEGPIADVLRAQNPSLYLTLSEDAGEELIDGAASVSRRADARVDQLECPALRIETEEQTIDVMLDPATHLVRRMSFDLSKSLEAQGVPQVKRAIVTVDYEQTKPGAVVAEDRFAWSAPAGATLARSVSDALAGGGGAGAAQALEGKAAPEFALQDLSGQTISLKELRGSVVVLDFWATWCPPCREGLPHLDALNKEFTDRGVKVFAVNLREDKATAEKFVRDTNLNLSVLLDETGKVAERYAVSGIPQTVVIDRRGKVVRVSVGFGPGSEAQVREAIEAALAVR